VSTVCVSDVDLVTRARQGDSAAFGELIDRHRNAVYRAARAALGSHADAEDAAQDAFLLAYTRLGSFRGDASFKTWLLTIVWHQAINRRRSLSRLWMRMIAATNEDEAEMIASVTAKTLTPEQATAHVELRRAVARAIRALTPKLRDALLLAQAGDYTYDEIGAMLDTPTGTVKWRVSEARRVVRTKLRAAGFDHV